MSSSSAPSPELVIKIAKIGVYTELTPPPVEVATAPEGIVTESFGPTQAVLSNAHLIHGTLNHNTPYQLRAGTPHNFTLQNMHFIEKLPHGGLLFRATGKTT